MIRLAEKRPNNYLAHDPSDVLEFNRYTQRVWSNLAGRPVSEEETDQIIEDFGRFLRALADGK